MKYRDLIQFEPIKEVVHFDRLSDPEYSKSLVRNFVFSKAYEQNIIPAICNNLDYTTANNPSHPIETFGLQIVGSYGTGKSHLMSLFSLIAEDADYLQYVNNDAAKAALGKIAGKYKVIRFELGNNQELWDIICYRIDEGLQKLGIDYSIAADKSYRSYTEKIGIMMAYFEQKYPDYGLMIIVDEMLSYLRGRAGTDALNRDLAALQHLGQSCDKSKFRMVFGVQELIYTAPEFQFAAKMLQQVSDRYRDLKITKQEVEYVVKKRLLKKDDAQKDIIRKHLNGFTKYFTEISKDIEDYVELFPVNPSYFDNFQHIKVAKAQREVLKTLSDRFSAIMDKEVPTSEPGLIGYDSYWEDMVASPDLQTDPDVRKVTEIMDIIGQKIDDNFRDTHAKKAPLARRIANACAIKILQEDIARQNGITAEALVDDLCYLDATCFDRGMLKDVIDLTATKIVTATVGQYFEKNDTNQEYHLRVQGGVNYEQKIKDYASRMTPDALDQYYYNYLIEFLPITQSQYRPNFKIFAQSILWRSHKMLLDGYIFLGNPDERSTTQPEQNFYIYFMPVFNKKNIRVGSEPDSIYIRLDSVSDELKEQLSWYAAAEALRAAAPTSERMYYDTLKASYLKKLRNLFDRDFPTSIKVFYQGKEQTLTPTQLMGESKEAIVTGIASLLLEDYFCEKRKNYPKFTLLPAPLTTQTQDSILKAARQKIAMPNTSNRSAEAVLAGLGLISENQLSLENSIYAQSLLKKLNDKGEGKVLNRDEIVTRFWEDTYHSVDYDIDSTFEYLVLAAMVALGEIEIDYPGGKNINAANIKEIIDVPRDYTYNFSHVRRPKGLNLPAVKELFLGITGRDLVSQIDDKSVFSELLRDATTLAQDIVTLEYKIKGGVSVSGIDVMDAFTANSISIKLDAIKGICDQVQNYGSKAKMRNIPWSAEALKGYFAGKAEIDTARKALEFRDNVSSRVSYLTQAQQYIFDEKLLADIKASLDKVKDIAAKKDDASAVNKYFAELDALIDRYIKWYLAEYDRLHISEFDFNRKNEINRSEDKAICDAAAGEDFIAITAQFSTWEQKMSELTPKSSTVTEQALKNTPYLGFNPMNFKNKTLPSLDALKTELEQMSAAVDKKLHITLADETLLKNAEDALSDYEKRVVKNFKDEDTTRDNVRTIIDIIHKLHKGILKITISDAELHDLLGSLLTPKDAVDKFRKFIADKTVGSEGQDVRIILK